MTSPYKVGDEVELIDTQDIYNVIHLDMPKFKIVKGTILRIASETDHYMKITYMDRKTGKILHISESLIYRNEILGQYKNKLKEAKATITW